MTKDMVFVEQVWHPGTAIVPLGQFPSTRRWDVRDVTSNKLIPFLDNNNIILSAVIYILAL